MYKKNLALYLAAEDSVKSVFVVSCLWFLPLLEFFVLLGALPPFFLQWELFHGAGLCLCITEGKLWKVLVPGWSSPKNWLDVWCLLAVAPFICTTASSCRVDLIPERCQRRPVSGIMQEPPFFCGGADKNLSLALPPDFWRQYFMQNHFLMRTVEGKSATEVHCTEWDLWASWGPSQTIPGQWDSGLLDELPDYFASFSQHGQLCWVKD